MVIPCPRPSFCPSVLPARCPSIRPTACGDCDPDQRDPEPCGVETVAGTDTPSYVNHGLGADPGWVRISYNMGTTIPDQLDCYYKGALVATTGEKVVGTGELFWFYDPQPGDPSTCLVVITPTPDPFTVWNYTVHCPDPNITPP